MGGYDLRDIFWLGASRAELTCLEQWTQGSAGDTFGHQARGDFCSWRLQGCNNCQRRALCRRRGMRWTFVQVAKFHGVFFLGGG